MGDPWGEDRYQGLLQDIQAVQDAGRTNAKAQGNATGGLFHPVVGDHGTPLNDSSSQSLTVELVVPPNVTRWVMGMYCRYVYDLSINATSRIIVEARKGIAVGGPSTASLWNEDTVSAGSILGTGPTNQPVHVYRTGTLPASFNPTGEVHSGVLRMQINKSNPQTGLSFPRNHWDGIWSIYVKLF